MNDELWADLMAAITNEQTDSARIVSAIRAEFGDDPELADGLIWIEYHRSQHYTYDLIDNHLPPK